MMDRVKQTVIGAQWSVQSGRARQWASIDSKIRVRLWYLSGCQLPAETGMIERQ